MVKQYDNAHSDSCSAIDIHPNGLHIISGGHDGVVRVWDLRMHKEVASGTGHTKKYEEAVMCVAVNSKKPMFGSGGADCLVNIYDFNF